MKLTQSRHPVRRRPSLLRPSRLGVGTISIAIATLAMACEKKSETTPTAASQAPASVTGAANPTTETTVTAATSTKASGGAQGGSKEPILTWRTGLSTPESVLYDDANDVYLTSNIEGSPLSSDNNGFISRLSPDGKVEALKFIQGGKNEAVLNAPKGLALVGNVLYVADIDTVRLFDRKTGMPQGEVKVPGATFLNDLAVTEDGRVLVSDTGLKAGKSGMEPTGADAVYAIDKERKVTTLAKAKELGNPNGLYAGTDKTWVANGSGELYSIDRNGKRGDVQKLPKGSLDGIVVLPGGDVLVSSWEAGAVYRGKPGGELKVAVDDVKSPADIGYDTKRNRLLVPLFEANEVRAYEMR